jgi:hypothetical protein
MSYSPGRRSADQVAKEAARSTKNYETIHALLKDDAWRVIGLLELILDELQRISAPNKLDKAIDLHRRWLNLVLPRCQKLARQLRYQQRRIQKLFGEIEIKSPDMSPLSFWYLHCLHQREESEQFQCVMTERRSALERLRAVRSREDIDELRDIGPKTKARLLAGG